MSMLIDVKEILVYTHSVTDFNMQRTTFVYCWCREQPCWFDVTYVLNTGLRRPFQSSLLRRHGKFWGECRIFIKCNTTVLSCLKYPNTLEFHIYLKSCTWFYRQSEGSVGEQTTSEFSLVKLIVYINGPLLISTLYSFWPVTELNLTCIYLFWWFLNFLF